MPFEVRLDSDLEALNREFRRDLANELRHEVKRACEIGADYARSHHPYQDRTYDLTGSIHGELVTFDKDSATGVLAADMDYASYVDEGTSRSRAFPFMDEARLVTESELSHGLQQAADRIASRLSK